MVPLRKVPLELVRCNPELDEDACGLVQLRHTFPSDIMYSDYWYASGVNQTMRDALADIARRAAEFVSLAENDIAVDIGCNDGTLLKAYKAVKDSLDLIGFDPAKNFVGVQEEGFQRINDYFNKASYTIARGTKKAKIVTSIAMFYDLEDPIAFSRDIADIMADDGIWILQMADLPNMLKHNMFDNICHEHVAYYHLAPLEYLLSKCGMKLVDVEMNQVNGSSYRFYIERTQGLSLLLRLLNASPEFGSTNSTWRSIQKPRIGNLRKTLSVIRTTCFFYQPGKGQRQEGVRLWCLDKG